MKVARQFPHRRFTKLKAKNYKYDKFFYFEVLAKMERKLGVKLRGKDIGQPLAPPGKTAAAAAKK